jgi:hypothetical protein
MIAGQNQVVFLILPQTGCENTKREDMSIFKN